MARLLILAHAPLASAFKAVAMHAFPELAHRVQALDVLPDEAPEMVEARAREWLAQPLPDASDGARETLVLTDVFGATPCNVAQRLSDDRFQVRVLAGLNVPMLWRALNYAALPLDDLLSRSMIGGAQGVLPIASTRPQNQAFPPRAYDPDQHHHQQ
jgi:PTS system mannose-specific IIA component